MSNAKQNNTPKINTPTNLPTNTRINSSPKNNITLSPINSPRENLVNTKTNVNTKKTNTSQGLVPLSMPTGNTNTVNRALTQTELNNLKKNLANTGIPSNNLQNINQLSSISNQDISKMSNKELENLSRTLENESLKLDNTIKKTNEIVNKNNSLSNQTNKVNNTKENIKEPTIITQIIQTGDETSYFKYALQILVGIIIIGVIIWFIRYLIIWYQTSSFNIPYLVPNTKNAKFPLNISQDPKNVNYIPINRSDGQDGIQFTYGFWFLIDNLEYKKGEWKHMFHKGNASSFPNRAPGVYIHPTQNTIRVYMNTQDNILEYVDVDNIPIRKWVYMNIILKQNTTDAKISKQGTTTLDIYINGYSKVRKELKSLPKQNDDDLWVNMFGGFEGYMSNMKYYPYAIDFNEINKNIKEGPSASNCIDTNEVPPYLDDNWWFSS